MMQEEALASFCMCNSYRTHTAHEQ